MKNQDTICRVGSRSLEPLGRACAKGRRHCRCAKRPRTSAFDTLTAAEFLSTDSPYKHTRKNAPSHNILSLLISFTLRFIGTSIFFLSLTRHGAVTAHDLPGTRPVLHPAYPAAHSQRNPPHYSRLHPRVTNDMGRREGMRPGSGSSRVAVEYGPHCSPSQSFLSHSPAPRASDLCLLLRP